MFRRSKPSLLKTIIALVVVVAIIVATVHAVNCLLIGGTTAVCGYIAKRKLRKTQEKKGAEAREC